MEKWEENLSKDKLKEKQIYLHPDSIIKVSLSIGSGTRVNGKIVVKGFAPCTIGKYCAVGWDVKINTASHVMNTANINVRLQHRIGAQEITTTKGKVTIGNNVWIGDSVMILSGITIGDGSVIGAGAVITHDVDPFTVVAGVPAKVIRRRFSDTIIEQLLKIQWWHWTEEKMKENREFFNLDLTEMPDADLKRFIK